MAKSVQDLAQALSESERKELFERIQRSLSLTGKQEQSIVKAPTSTDYRSHMIQEGLAQLGLVQRLLLWIKKVFSNKSDADVFVEMKMEEIAAHIDKEGLGDTVAKTLGPRFIQRIYELYVVIVPIKQFLRYVWANEEALRAALQFVLEERVPKARSRLFDFIPFEEIQMLFEASENKATIRQELISRLNSYIDNIPGEIFTELEQGILPLYYLRQLCFFDFTGLFRAFFADVSKLEKGTPNFKSTGVDRVMDKLEELYYAMHTARKSTSAEILPPQLYKYVQQKKAESAQSPAKAHEQDSAVEGMDAPAALNESRESLAPEAASPGGVAPTAETPALAASPAAAPQAISPAEAAVQKAKSYDEGLRALRKDLKELQEVLAHAMEKSRIADIIKFFQGDPYYRFLAYVPGINLKEFYISTLRMQLLGALDKEYVTIRSLIVANIVKSLFPKGIVEFTHFKRHPQGPLRGSLPGFRYVNSLQYLYSFLAKVFMGGIREICRSVVKSLPNRNRDTGSELMFHTGALENCYESLKALDHALSPDSDEGKNFMRLRSSVEKDVTMEKQFRAYVAQRDKANRDILEEAIEHLRALSEAVSDVAAIPSPLLSERVSLIAAQGGTQGNFGDFMRVVALKLRTADRLLRYQRALDDELPA